MKTRLLVRKSITGFGIILAKLGKIIYQSEYERNRDRWYSDGAEDTKRIDFDGLGSNSVVLDAGGWQGNWASDIYSKYMPIIHVFEPVTQYAELISKRFEMNPQVNVYEYGLGGATQNLPIFIGNEGSSVFVNDNTSSVKEEIRILDVKEFLEKNNIKKIDLFKINIEGGEYELLERLIEVNKHLTVDRFLIQFHDFVLNAEERRSSIRYELSQTHDLLFDYPFVWECWEKKNLGKV